jgi:hypothetical protein
MTHSMFEYYMHREFTSIRLRFDKASTDSDDQHQLVVAWP